ncbi:MAG TPA: glycoside hydrolase family 6 protein [Nocardioidaceae bacterium]|nr:glycoside hydrolase family 6 protein [Nocardioidaceae bacterium]
MAVLSAGLLSIGPSAPASARATDQNPLAAGVWGVYDGVADGIYPAFELAGALTSLLLGKIALAPRTRWLGKWISEEDITYFVQDHIADSQDGDPTKLVTMATFRLWPDNEDALDVPLTLADRAAYRRWVDNAARGIGSSRVALVLEPDIAVARNGWRPNVRYRLARYASEVFGALPNTSIYIDASSADWLPLDEAITMLLKAGVENARGFALGATHYDSTAANIRYGRDIVAGLARHGVPNRHFVIDTADNGRPFTMKQFRVKHPNADFDNAATCRTVTETRCVTLGIPPTADVASPKWGLGDRVRAIAAKHVDAFLWFGRPWLTRQAAPFDLLRALAIASTTPY